MGERAEGRGEGAEAAMGAGRRDVFPFHHVQGQTIQDLSPGLGSHPLCAWAGLMCTLGLLDEMVPESHPRPAVPWVHESPRPFPHLP